MFHWKFIIYLQTRDTLYLIATEIAKSKGFFQKFILSLYSHENAVLAGYWREWFTACLQKQQASHLIGQKSGDFQPLRLKVYILFTKFSSLCLYSLKNNFFLTHISKNYISPHLYPKNRGSEGVFWKMIYSFFTKTKVSSSNRTKKWQNIPLAMKGLHFVYRI